MRDTYFSLSLGLAVSAGENRGVMTLQNGYTQLDRFDAAALPPPGSSVPGRTETSVQGSLHSAQAGGIVEVATLPGAPFLTYDADAYPRAGVLQVKGQIGRAHV